MSIDLHREAAGVITAIDMEKQVDLANILLEHETKFKLLDKLNDCFIKILVR